jgi:hypothetical protein
MAMSKQGQHEYRYVAEYLTENREELGSLPLDPDFGPARECCQLAGVSAGVLSSTAALPPGSILPVWAGEAGAPRVKALRVSMDAERGDGQVVVDLEASHYFRAAIRRGASRLVERNVIPAGGFYRHRILAYPVAAGATRTASDRPLGPRPLPDGDAGNESDDLLAFDFDDSGDASPIVTRSLGELVGDAGVEAGEDCPVVVHADVERDLLALAEAAGENECGAGLLGHLARDAESGRLFVEVTALAPVRGGLSEKRSFLFTDESWASVHEIAALRGLGELVCGYAHSHPNFCAKCPAERQASCVYSRSFFSEDDVHLQRTCFPKAWQVALLASDLPGRGRVVDLFGWDKGVVTARRYAVARARALDDASGGTREPAQATNRHTGGATA